MHKRQHFLFLFFRLLRLFPLTVSFGNKLWIKFAFLIVWFKFVFIWENLYFAERNQNLYFSSRVLRRLEHCHWVHYQVVKRHLKMVSLKSVSDSIVWKLIFVFIENYSITRFLTKSQDHVLCRGQRLGRNQWTNATKKRCATHTKWWKNDANYTYVYDWQQISIMNCKCLRWWSKLKLTNSKKSKN